MNIIRLSSLATAFTAAFAVSAIAQTTILVGPGGYAQPTQAMLAAQDGDVIEIAPGSYQTFFCGKSVTIRAVTPGTVSVDIGSPAGFATSLWPPADGVIHVIGVNFAVLDVRGGRVTLDQCRVQSTSGLIANDAALHLQSCEIRAATFFTVFAVAMRLTNSQVTAIDSTIAGPVGGIGKAVEISNGSLHGSRLTIASGTASTFPAVTADATSAVWLSESSVAGNAPCPIVASHGHLHRCTLTPACAPLPTDLVLGVSRSQPWQTGASCTLQFDADPGQAIAVFASTSLDATAIVGIEQEVALYLPATFLAAQLVADGLGDASVTWTLPSAPILVGRTLWLQALGGVTAPLQMSPVAGGVVR